MAEPRTPDISSVSAVWDAAGELEIRVDYDGGTNPIYVGWAIPGSTTAEAAWKIIKLTFDGNDNPTRIEHASDAPGFSYVWDDRASLF